MKYNLKNFPRIPNHMKNEKDAEKWLEDLNEWHEGFEKELRRRYDRLQKCMTDSCLSERFVLKEILGEI